MILLIMNDDTIDNNTNSPKSSNVHRALIFQGGGGIDTARLKIDSIPAPLSLVIKCGFISRSSSRRPLTFIDMPFMLYFCCHL